MPKFDFESKKVSTKLENFRNVKIKQSGFFDDQFDFHPTNPLFCHQYCWLSSKYRVAGISKNLERYRINKHTKNQNLTFVSSQPKAKTITILSSFDVKGRWQHLDFFGKFKFFQNYSVVHRV